MTKLEVDPLSADDRQDIISPRAMQEQARKLISRMPEQLQRIATGLLNSTMQHCSSRLQTIFLERRMKEGGPLYQGIIMQVFVEERYEIYRNLLRVLQEEMNAAKTPSDVPLPLEAYDWM